MQIKHNPQTNLTEHKTWRKIKYLSGLVWKYIK